MKFSDRLKISKKIDKYYNEVDERIKPVKLRRDSFGAVTALDKMKLLKNNDANNIKYLEFIITDQNGAAVKNGDEIFVRLPCIDTHDNHYESDTYASEKVLKCSLRLQLSRGLVIRVLEVVKDEDPDEDQWKIKKGDTIQFRRIAWEWWKA